MTLEPRDLGDRVMAEVDRDGAISLTLRSAYGRGAIDRITLQPETQQALRRYMDDLQRAIEQRNVGPNASAQNAAYGANEAAQQGPNPKSLIQRFVAYLTQMSSDDWYKALLAYNTAANDSKLKLNLAEWYAQVGDPAIRERQVWWDRLYNSSMPVAWNTVEGRFIARHAAYEIRDADLMRESGRPFVFLPMFGFRDDWAVLWSESHQIALRRKRASDEAERAQGFVLRRPSVPKASS